MDVSDEDEDFRPSQEENSTTDTVKTMQYLIEAQCNPSFLLYKMISTHRAFSMHHFFHVKISQLSCTPTFLELNISVNTLLVNDDQIAVPYPHFLKNGRKSFFIFYLSSIEYCGCTIARVIKHKLPAHSKASLI